MAGSESSVPGFNPCVRKIPWRRKWQSILAFLPRKVIYPFPYFCIQIYSFVFIQFSSVTQSCPTLCDPMNHTTPGLPVHHQLLESTQNWTMARIQIFSISTFFYQPGELRLLSDTDFCSVLYSTNFHKELHRQSACLSTQLWILVSVT